LPEVWIGHPLRETPFYIYKTRYLVHTSAHALTWENGGDKEKKMAFIDIHYDIEHKEFPDEDVVKEVSRVTDDPDLLGVTALEWNEEDLAGEHGDSPSWGQVSVTVVERLSGPLEDELREEIAEALWDVPGVTDVCEGEEPDIWEIDGDPSGEELVKAAADVVDGLTERVRDYLRSALPPT
jgi:hypothetical protein